ATSSSDAAPPALGRLSLARRGHPVSTIAIIYLALILLLLGTLASRGMAWHHREVLSVTLGSTVRLLAGLVIFAGTLYVTAYFLALVGGFYESLTCKVVTLPA